MTFLKTNPSKAEMGQVIGHKQTQTHKRLNTASGGSEGFRRQKGNLNC